MAPPPSFPWFTLGFHVHNGNVRRLRPWRVALVVLLLTGVLPVPPYQDASASLGGHETPPTPHGDNLFRFYMPTLEIVANMDNGTGENIQPERGNCAPTGTCLIRNPPFTSTQCLPVAGGAPGCVAARLATLANVADGNLYTSTAVNPSGYEFFNLQKGANASTPDNATFTRIVLPEDAPFTNAQVNFLQEVPGSDFIGGSVTYWAEAKADNGTIMDVRNLGTHSCTTGGNGRTISNVTWTVPRVEAKTYTIFANKTLCTWSGGASSTTAVKAWLGVWSYWSEDSGDAEAFSNKEVELGDFNAQAEGVTSITVGASVDLETINNATLTIPAGKSFWGYYPLGCATSGFNFNCANAATGPRRFFQNATEPCFTHEYQGAAGASTNYLSIFRTTNTCTVSASFRVGGWFIAGTYPIHYFLDHDEYFGNTFGKGGGDFDNGGGTRPRGAPCWDCPGRTNTFTTIGLAYQEDRGTLVKAPLASAMSDNVNVDFNNAETASLGFNTDSPRSITVVLEPSTYWGNAIMWSVTVANNTNTNPEECTDDNMPIHVDGNLASVTRTETWQFNATARAITCFWLIKDFHREDPANDQLYNNGRDTSGLTFLINVGDWPTTWKTGGPGGAPYAARGIDNFAGNKSEYLGCTRSGTANYCFGNMDTTGFFLPGLSVTSDWTFCTFHGRSNPVGSGDAYPNGTQTTFLPGVTVFEAQNALTNTTANTTAPAISGTGCTTNSPRANMTLDGSRLNFTFTHPGFHDIFANYTGVAENARYVVAVYMNQTERPYSFQGPCTNIPDPDNPNGTLFYCSIVAAPNPFEHCDEFDLEGDIESQQCTATGPGAGSQGGNRIWQFDCALDATTNAVIHALVTANPGGFTSELNFAARNEPCPSINTTGVKGTNVILYWSKQGYNTLRFVVPSWAFNTEVGILQFQASMLCGNSETILTTATHIQNGTRAGPSPFTFLNYTAFTLVDNASRGACLTDKGARLPPGVQPVPDLIEGLFIGVGLVGESGRAIAGLFLVIIILLSCVYLWHRHTGTVPSGAFVAVIGIPSFLVVGMMGFWPAWLLILSTLAVIAVFSAFLFNRFRGGNGGSE